MARLFADIYDFVMAPLEKRGIARIRKKIVSGLAGKVLEIGAGTGANFPFYSADKISSVDVLEPNPHMLEKAKSRVGNSPISVNFHQGIAETLPFKDGQFDTVVATLVLCSVDEPEKVFQEIRRDRKSVV